MLSPGSLLIVFAFIFCSSGRGFASAGLCEEAVKGSEQPDTDLVYSDVFRTLFIPILSQLISTHPELPEEYRVAALAAVKHPPAKILAKIVMLMRQSMPLATIAAKPDVSPSQLFLEQLKTPTGQGLLNALLDHAILGKQRRELHDLFQQYRTALDQYTKTQKVDPVYALSKKIQEKIKQDEIPLSLIHIADLYTLIFHPTSAGVENHCRRLLALGLLDDPRFIDLVKNLPHRRGSELELTLTMISYSDDVTFAKHRPFFEELGENDQSPFNAFASYVLLLREKPFSIARFQKFNQQIAALISAEEQAYSKTYYEGEAPPTPPTIFGSYFLKLLGKSFTLPKELYDYVWANSATLSPATMQAVLLSMTRNREETSLNAKYIRAIIRDTSADILTRYTAIALLRIHEEHLTMDDLAYIAAPENKFPPFLLPVNTYEKLPAMQVLALFQNTIVTISESSTQNNEVNWNTFDARAQMLLARDDIQALMMSSSHVPVYPRFFDAIAQRPNPPAHIVGLSLALALTDSTRVATVLANAHFKSIEATLARKILRLKYGAKTLAELAYNDQTPTPNFDRIAELLTVVHGGERVFAKDLVLSFLPILRHLPADKSQKLLAALTEVAKRLQLWAELEGLLSSDMRESLRTDLAIFIASQRRNGRKEDESWRLAKLAAENLDAFALSLVPKHLYESITPQASKPQPRPAEIKAPAAPKPQAGPSANEQLRKALAADKDNGDAVLKALQRFAAEEALTDFEASEASIVAASDRRVARELVLRTSLAQNISALNLKRPEKISGAINILTERIASGMREISREEYQLLLRAVTARLLDEVGVLQDEQRISLKQLFLMLLQKSNFVLDDDVFKKSLNVLATYQQRTQSQVPMLVEDLHALAKWLASSSARGENDRADKLWRLLTASLSIPKGEHIPDARLIATIVAVHRSWLGMEESIEKGVLAAALSRLQGFQDSEVLNAIEYALTTLGNDGLLSSKLEEALTDPRPYRLEPISFLSAKHQYRGLLEDAQAYEAVMKGELANLRDFVYEPRFRLERSRKAEDRDRAYEEMVITRDLEEKVSTAMAMHHEFNQGWLAIDYSAMNMIGYHILSINLRTGERRFIDIAATNLKSADYIGFSIAQDRTSRQKTLDSSQGRANAGEYFVYRIHMDLQKGFSYLHRYLFPTREDLRPHEVEGANGIYRPEGFEQFKVGETIPSP